MGQVVFLSPVARQLFLNPANGSPASGYKLFTYAAGTTTKISTYTNSSGNVQNTNPIALDTLGECDLWLIPGILYKFVFSPPTDTDPPTNPIWTRDNIQASGSGVIGSGVVVNGSSNITAAAETISVYGSAPNTQTLPATPILWERHTIKDAGGNSSTNTITISGNGNNIDGLSTASISFNGESLTFQWDGTQWILE